LNEKNELSR